jgi:hypothetical protein
MERAYEEGRTAFRHGELRRSNPYARYSAPFVSWYEGWDDEMWKQYRVPDYYNHITGQCECPHKQCVDLGVYPVPSKMLPSMTELTNPQPGCWQFDTPAKRER